MLDLRADPVVTLETLKLSADIERERTGIVHQEVVLTPEQHSDVYSELQGAVRFQSVSSADGPVKWSGMTLTAEAL